MDEEWPDTGNTVKYTFKLSNMTMAPDGVSRHMQVVNGQYPGPTIEANWGDNIEVTVVNNLVANGTGIHWHGLRMLGTNDMDGTAGLTECPIAPGESKTYKFKATQYGTSWWHSHYSVQYGDGVVGPIVIHGPATKNYDIDLGPLPFTDWFHLPIYTVNSNQLHAFGPPVADNLLVNGSMTSSDGGQYAVTHLTPGKSHLLRLINTGINNWVNVALDGHTFTVIAADFVPIVPYTTHTLTIAVGQRYDVVIDANETIGNYWLRVGTGGGSCDGPNTNADNIRSIFRYKGAPDENPNSSPSAPLSTGCADETSLEPWVETQVPQDMPKEMEVSFSNTVVSGANLVQWLIDDSPMHINFSRPSIQKIFNGNNTFDRSENIYDIGKANTFQYWVIQQDPNNLAAVPHPIHLHGHDFYLLELKDSGTWDGDTSRLNTDNPVRRDTVTLPGKGYIVLAFESDNPGVWLMHCHIPFHASQGFSIQFAERKSDIKGGSDSLTEECNSWISYREKYYPDGFTEGDSHL
ncbi:laccase, multicopper oxidase, benzenediol:oxygen oxidorectuctase [Kalmusia sp. IMI 367209]|nr:laccase, multicopper oxidase, benzenediol:oxygen oxidorectuctase [Kalmusia sp. IMI 367209]